LQQDACAVTRGCNHVVFRLALRDRELDTGGTEDFALDRKIVKIIVGEQDAGHDRETAGATGRSAAPRYVRRRNWSSGFWRSCPWGASLPL
jgi:hypothetical protein